MDFGLAKGQRLRALESQAGGLIGTLRYAAPEQLAAASLRVGPAADVRGLGVTLWELLTRRRLFHEAEDERQLAAMIYDRDVPRLRSIDTGLDRDLEAIVARATERRAADRIATAALVAQYLQLYLDGEALPIRPPATAEIVGRWFRDHRAMVVSVAAASITTAAAVLVALVLVIISRNNEATRPARGPEAATEAGQLAARNKDLAAMEEAARKNAERQSAHFEAWCVQCSAHQGEQCAGNQSGGGGPHAR